MARPGDGISNAALLAGDWQRHQKALGTALGQAQLLQQQLDRTHLLSSDSVRDRVAVRILQDDPAGQPRTAAAAGQQSPGRRRPAAAVLLEAARLQHTEAHADVLTALASEVAALHVTAAALDADEANLRTRFLPKPRSLAAVIADDERLAGLSEAQILAEVRTQAADGAKRARLLGLRSQIATEHSRDTQQCTPAPCTVAAAVSGSRPGSHASSRQQSQGGSSGGDEDEGADDDDDSGSDGDADSCSQGLAGEASQSEVQPQLVTPPEDLPGMLAIIKGQRQCGRRNPVPLEAVAASLARDLPQQQEQLALLKRVSAYTSARLRATAERPSTCAGQLALTAQQRNIRGLAQDLIDELIASALAHVDMRPSRAVVDLELAEWGVGQPAALAAISRHISDGLYKEVVDELLAEVAGEVLTSAAAAEAFSSDMLVAAVAFSTGKFDLGFTAGQVPHKRGVGGVAREAALLRKVASTKSTAILTGAGVDTPTSNTPATSSSSSSTRNRSFGGLKPLPLPDSSELVYLARRDFAALDNAFSSAAVGPTASPSLLGPSGFFKAGSSPTAAVSSSQQQQQSGHSKYARGLYLSGLRGMLAEMQAVRPHGTPYGHTQQLTARLNPARGKAARLAVSRARPPLSACGRVWALRQGPLGRLEVGSWAGQHHMAAAAKERAYWSRVAVRGYLMVPAPKTASPTATPVSSCTVPPALGAISCVSASPARHLLSVGTDRGAVLVWDVSSDTPAAPVFQVSGMGAMYKQSGWWKPWQNSTQQQPAITGLAWSADGFQLAALDGSSNLKLWWMTPEKHGPGEAPPPAGVPPAPQLAVLVTPHNVAVSGKAPIPSNDGTALLAAQESVHGPATAGSSSSASKGGVLPKLGQLLGLSGPTDSKTQAQQGAATVGAAAGELSAGSGGLRHVCRPVFHPARTAAGTQPTLVIPQVTGDVLSLTTAVAEAAVQPGPAATASQAAVGAALASGLTAAARGAAGGGSTGTGRGQVPAGAVLAGTPSTATAAAVTAVENPAAAASTAAGGSSKAAGASRPGVASSSSSVGSRSVGRSSSFAANGSSSAGASSSSPTLQQQQQQQQQQQSPAGALLPQAVVDYLMPPQQVNTDIEQQSLYRVHSSPLVFLGFLSDDASLVSLDASGLLALWPPDSDSQRSGFGWLKPRARWQLPRMLKTCQLRGGTQHFFPAPGSTQLPAPAASTTNSGSSATTNCSSSSSSSWYVRYVPDEQDAADAVRLQGDPSGEFLLGSRTPWLVRYLPQPAARQQAGGGSIIRQVFHRPPDEAEPASAASARLRSSSSSSSKCVVVSSYDAATGALLSRAKQRCTFTKAPAKVVSAQLTPSKRELLVLCTTPPAPDDASALATLSAHTLDLRTMRAAVPRIDLPDVTSSASGTSGAHCPAFALTTPLVSTGSEYLIADLGCGAVGVCSLATGQLVRELRLHSMAPAAAAAGPGARLVLSGLQWMRVRGGGGAAGKEEGRTLLAAACVGGQALCLIQLDTDAAAQQLKAEQDQQQQQGATQPGVRQPAAGKQQQSVFQQQPMVQQQQQQQHRQTGTVPAQQRQLLQRQQARQESSRQTPPDQPPAGRASTQHADAAGRRSSVRFADPHIKQQQQQQQQQRDNG